MSDSRLVYVVRHEEKIRETAPKDWAIVVQRQSLDDDGNVDGLFWEFVFRWHDWGAEGQGVQVQIFDDAWQCFTEIPELFATLADRHKETTRAPSMMPTDAVKMLDSLGFVDVTQREGPF